MASTPTTEVETIVNEMIEGGAKLDGSQLGKIAEAIGRVFAVHADEVAILSVTADQKFLRFRVPKQLHDAGQIPLTSNTSLAARTVRAKKAEIANHFPIVPHAAVFESIKLKNERGEPIQKILSAPIFIQGKVAGVVQVSRKAATAKAAQDFSAEDLRQLVSIAELLAAALPLAEA